MKTQQEVRRSLWGDISPHRQLTLKQVSRQQDFPSPLIPWKWNNYGFPITFCAGENGHVTNREGKYLHWGQKCQQKLYFSYKKMVLDLLDLLYILSGKKSWLLEFPPRVALHCTAFGEASHMGDESTGNRSKIILCINWWLILESETKRSMRITYYNRLPFYLAINSTILCFYDLYGVDLLERLFVVTIPNQQW